MFSAGFMDSSGKAVSDLEALKAIAHPLRMRLLAALREHGPATASELGRRLGEFSGSASNHLRQLDRYGLVADDDADQSRCELAPAWQPVLGVNDWPLTGSALVAHGRVADSRRRRPLMVAAALFALASCLRFAFAGTLGWFIAAAALQGVFRALAGGPAGHRATVLSLAAMVLQPAGSGGALVLEQQRRGHRRHARGVMLGAIVAARGD